MSIHNRRKAGQQAGLPYEVRWREGGVQRKRRFAKLNEAEKFDARRRTAPEVRRAAEGRVLPVRGMMATWLATTAGLEPATQAAYRQEVRQVLLTFGDRLASTVRPSEIRAWAARSHPGTSIRRRSLVALRRAYRLAVADGFLAEDPTAGAPLPRVDREEMRFLTLAELATLAEAAGEYAPMVWVLGVCGLRIGEAAALNCEDVDRRRGRLRIRRAKNHQARDVPVPAFVLDMLRQGSGPLFLSPAGLRVSAHNWRERHFRRAVDAAGLGPLHPHQLRHTAASLAIAAGADVKVVQQMLGHNSGAMTIDLYGHLLDSRLDTVAVRMDSELRAHLGRIPSGEGASRAHSERNPTPLDSTPDASEAAVIQLPTRWNAL